MNQVKLNRNYFSPNWTAVMHVTVVLFVFTEVRGVENLEAGQK